MNFPEWGLREHHEAETNPTGKETSPCIIAAVKSGTNLVNVISASEPPFHIIVSKDVIGVLEFGWVSLGLDWFVIWTVQHCEGVVIEVVVALGGLVSQVVELWVGILAESAHSVVGQHSLNTFVRIRELHLRAPISLIVASFLIII